MNDGFVVVAIMMGIVSMISGLFFLDQPTPKLVQDGREKHE